MLTNLKPREVSTSGITETRSFTIRANGNAFKVLIDGLYSDKPRAVVRELWSNAFDSHIAVGTSDVPFDCQLPTVFDPVFRVRDYGVSLSHEDVMGLYTTVFHSTKDGTNAQVGKLGLGSKSPFAYVDTFAVTCWLAGEKRVYSAFIGADYVPQIAYMGSEPCLEPTGLEVSFPVQTEDVEAFATAAKKVALGFKVLPNIIGRSVAFTELETVMEDAPLWALVKAHDWQFNARTAYARQGCVVYPIDAGAIRNITPVQSAILRSPFFIEFPIGDLEIAASREALGYTPATCKNILSAVDIIVEELRRRYQEEINGSATYWEACVAYAYLQSGDLHDGVKKAVSEGLTWRGRKLKVLISLYDAITRSMGSVQCNHVSPSSSRRRRSLKWEPGSHVGITPLTDGIYLENTTQRTSLVSARIRFHYDSSSKTSLAWFKADPASRAWKRVYAAMGRPPIVQVETLPKPPVEKGYGVKKPVPMKRLSDRGNEFVSTLIDEDDDIVYVRMERGDVEGPLGGTSTAVPTRVQIALTMLIKHNILPVGTLVIGVPKSHAKKIDRHPHWRSFWDLCRKAIADNFDPRLAAKASTCVEIVNEDRMGFVRELGEHTASPAFKGPAYRLLRLFQSVKQRAADHETQNEWLSFAQNILQSVQLPTYKVRWQPVAVAFETAYPLIKMVGFFNDKNRSALLDYVNLVDSAAGLPHVVNEPDTNTTVKV